MRLHRRDAIAPAARRRRAGAGAGLLHGLDSHAALLEGLRALSHFLALLAAEMRAPVRLPLNCLLRGWAKGFGRLPYMLYGLERRDSSLYLSSYRQHVSSLKINGAMDHVINNKLLLPMLMMSAGLRTATILAFCLHGRWRAAAGRPIDDIAGWLQDRLLPGEKAVAKPARGCKGRGVIVLERTASGMTVNGEPCVTKELARLLFCRRDMVLTEFVEQAAYAQALYASTANSLRVLTAWDLTRGEPFVAAAAQRIGTRRSFPVDNWLEGLGGLSAEVDLATGRLSAGAAVENRRRVAWHERHPESGAPIAGVTIPGWTAIGEALCRGASCLPFAPLLGWDILVTESGFQVLELNGPPGLALHQVHRPLLADARLRQFYVAHGVLPKAAASGPPREGPGDENASPGR